MDGALSQDIEVTLTKEGVYVYQCTPHNMMAMIGVIKVESSANLEQVKQNAEVIQKNIFNESRKTRQVSFTDINMRLQIVKEQADENTFQEWREEDYMNKMDFNPLVMFVVIPTIVQAGCLIFMGAAMLLNTAIFA